MEVIVNKYPDKERYESAEALLKTFGTGQYSQREVLEHFTKFDPPDPDKELRERVIVFENWLDKHGFQNFEELYNKMIELNYLATQAHDNEVRSKMLDQVVYSFNKFQNNATKETIKELRTRYKTEGE